jgi:hypothetical protein
VQKIKSGKSQRSYCEKIHICPIFIEDKQPTPATEAKAGKEITLGSERKIQNQSKYLLVFVGVDLGVVEFTCAVFLPAHQVCIHSGQHESYIVIETNCSAFNGFNGSWAALVHPCNLPALNY